jgi:hypothetical protein
MNDGDFEEEFIEDGSPVFVDPESLEDESNYFSYYFKETGLFKTPSLKWVENLDPDTLELLVTTVGIIAEESQKEEEGEEVEISEESVDIFLLSALMYVSDKYLQAIKEMRIADAVQLSLLNEPITEETVWKITNTLYVYAPLTSLLRKGLVKRVSEGNGFALDDDSRYEASIDFLSPP